MSSLKLKDRIESYINTTNHQMMSGTPLVVYLNGRSFSKLTDNLDKPFDDKLNDCFYATMFRLCNELQEVLFAYGFNDEMVLILKNQSIPGYYQNKIQSIVSIASSVATLTMNQSIAAQELDVLGDALFTAHVFQVPSIEEAINTIIYYQQHNQVISLKYACYYHLLDSASEDKSQTDIKEFIRTSTGEEQLNLLEQEGVIFSDLPSPYRRGYAYYRIPKETTDGISKKIWRLNKILPLFAKDSSIIESALTNGVVSF